LEELSKNMKIITTTCQKSWKAYNPLCQLLQLQLKIQARYEREHYAIPLLNIMWRAKMEQLIIHTMWTRANESSYWILTSLIYFSMFETIIIIRVVVFVSMVAS